jgi:hypothetical protein
MRWQNRLRRIEQAVRERELQPPRRRIFFTAEERVQCVRAILARLHPQFVHLNLADPFPDLESEDYLRQFLWWFFENGEHWPMWAQDMVSRMLFSPDDSGDSLPWLTEEFRTAIADAKARFKEMQHG